MSAAETITGIIEARIAELRDEADGDVETLLRLCGAELTHSVAYQHRIEEMRDEAAQVLRERGMTMGKIARLAQVSDSYLSRRLIGRGSARRVVRNATGVLVIAAACLTFGASADARLVPAVGEQIEQRLHGPHDQSADPRPPLDRHPLSHVRHIHTETGVVRG